jgi:RNA polymerase-binding transcription factor DksA
VEKQAQLLTELQVRRDEGGDVREPLSEDDQRAFAQESSIVRGLSAIESGELSRVNAALERIRAGTYGICERCGSPVSTVRLRAIPWAEHCLRCAAPEVEQEPAVQPEARWSRNAGCAKSPGSSAT